MEARRDPARALALLQQAADSYRAALAREEDALTVSNLADALVQQAALACEAGQGQVGGALFGEAMAAYQRACGLSDAADGDDVPGLLLNWSRGLLAMAQQAQVSGRAGAPPWWAARMPAAAVPCASPRARLALAPSLPLPCLPVTLANPTLASPDLSSPTRPTRRTRR